MIIKLAISSTNARNFMTGLIEDVGGKVPAALYKSVHATAKTFKEASPAVKSVTRDILRSRTAQLKSFLKNHKLQEELKLFSAMV